MRKEAKVELNAHRKDKHKMPLKPKNRRVRRRETRNSKDDAFADKVGNWKKKKGD